MNNVCNTISSTEKYENYKVHGVIVFVTLPARTTKCFPLKSYIINIFTLEYGSEEETKDEKMSTVCHL